PPFFIYFLLLGGPLDCFRKFQQALRSVVPSIEKDVLYPFQQFFVDLVVYLQHGWIHNTHIHTVADSVVKKCGMHCLPHFLVPAETEGNVTHSTAYVSMWQVLAYPLRSAEEIKGVVSVFLDACRHREYVGIEDDI